MNKKGSMELSVNSIVILVIAIVMLGLILGFVKSKFTEVSKDLVKEEPEPPKASSSDILMLSRYTITAGTNEKFALKVEYYNPGTTPVANAKPDISCQNSQGGNAVPPISSAIARNAIAGQSNPYTVIITAPQTKDMYLCTVTIGPATNREVREFTLKVI